MTSVSVPAVNAAGEAVSATYENDLPAVSLPRAPASGLVWARAVTLAGILFTLYTIDRLTILFADFWFLQSLGFESVFWTNFRMGATLYVGALLLFAVAGAVPAYVTKVSDYVRGMVVKASLLIATIAAFSAAVQYHEFLLGGAGMKFDRTDPVFGYDIGFFIFNLPNVWTVVHYAAGASMLMLASAIICAFAAHEPREEEAQLSRVARLVAIAATPVARFAFGACAITGAVAMWLTRFDVLNRNNYDSSIPAGAEYIDITGLFSTLNYISVTSAMILAGGFILLLQAKHAHRAATGRADYDWRASIRGLGTALVVVILFDFGFKGAVVLRDVLAVRPNEPVVQLPYIERHVLATREGYGLEGIEEISWLPNRTGDPMPTAEELLASPTLKNVPLWPGYASYLDNVVDPQHANRILTQMGDPMVYGPSLEVFRQQQKLRTYYNFLGLDTVRYEIDGETKLFTSGVRETPLLEPVPWLTYWGQRFMLYTHGYGLVMAPASAKSADGEPVFASSAIPPVVTNNALAVQNQRVYYGEGSATMAFSNVAHMKELDFPTDQDREQYWMPADIKSGVHMDSLFKKMVFGWRSRMFFRLVFSDLITDETRVHYLRMPIERLERIAPFLFIDSNPYAVAADGKIVWLVNGMTTADRYPYSLKEELGDKSDERSTLRRRGRYVNYVEDSVKATIDADTGQVKLYKIKDAPVVNAWAKVYPDMFVDGAKMPEAIRSQLTYPTQLFHVQFDDIYIVYHQKDPMYFFNMEDMWDDGDEVLGPIADTGKAITFSMEAYPWIAVPGGGVLPESKRKTQFAMAMPFSNEKAPNLRALPLVYQDPPDYGKLAVLEVPKGAFITGPEQADAAIDQDPIISQSFSWWNRRGTEVIRGHTTPLVVGKELIYVEPIYLRSQQNPVPQLKRVIVVFRGTPYMGDTLEDAIRMAVAGQKTQPMVPVVEPKQAAGEVPAQEATRG